MDVGALLAEALGRLPDQVDAVLDGLTEEELAWRPDGRANPIGWLVWHLTRVTDDHVADVAGDEQLWTSGGWVERFGLPLDVGDIGFGHSSDEVARVRAPADLLAAYHRAVLEASATYVGRLSAADLDRIVDERWDPPVTLGARLVSVVGEVDQHLGQAAYVRGLLERR
ncbi:MAG: mycothiol transferase [Marmoricola sp.]